MSLLFSVAVIHGGTHGWCRADWEMMHNAASGSRKKLFQWEGEEDWFVGGCLVYGLRAGE